MARGSKPGERRGGRKAGTPNKITAEAKEAFQLAFDGAGGVKALTDWAKKNPNLFYPLFSKLIPHQVTADIETTMTVDLKKAL